MAERVGGGHSGGGSRTSGLRLATDAAVGEPCPRGAGFGSAVRWIILYATWMLLLVGSLFATLALAGDLARLAAASVALPGAPGADGAGASVGLAIWLVVWIRHLLHVQDRTDAADTCDDGPVLEYERDGSTPHDHAA